MKAIGMVVVGVWLAALVQPVSAAPDLDALTQLDFRKVVTEAKGKVFPAVVFIKAVRESFESGRKSTQEVSGSGVLISADGEVLTNWHVVDKALEVRCLLFDGRAFSADVVGTDKDTDVALLKLKGRSRGVEGEAVNLPHARMGDSTRLTEGDFVMAMGAPWGLSRSVSIGIISCTRRFLPESSEYSPWLQTDAAISPGNSGGPLVNTAGEVIGLNARGMIMGGDMGFAIPARTLVELVPQLRQHGRVNWMWLGIRLQPLNDFNRNMYFGGGSGVMVADTEPDSPARQAGLQPRDRILSVNGTPLMGITDEDLPDIRRQLALLPADKAAEFRVQRGEKELVVKITPREKGKTQGDEHDCPRWDFTVRTINQFDNPDLFFHRNEGVFVQGIKMPGNAAGSGLQQQDIILRVNGEAVTTLDDVKRVHEQTLKRIDREHRVVLNVLRNGMMRQIVIDISRDFRKE